MVERCVEETSGLITNYSRPESVSFVHRGSFKLRGGGGKPVSVAALVVEVGLEARAGGEPSSARVGGGEGHFYLSLLSPPPSKAGIELCLRSMSICWFPIWQILLPRGLLY